MADGILAGRGNTTPITWFRLVRRTIHTPSGSPVSEDAESDPETPKNIKELHSYRGITDKLFAGGDASPRQQILSEYQSE
ncbi:hypothetical protein OXX80_004067 [Metschnikowia pulcherrima]